jgi:hypothetical protein
MQVDYLLLTEVSCRSSSSSAARSWTHWSDAVLPEAAGTSVWLMPFSDIVAFWICKQTIIFPGPLLDSRQAQFHTEPTMSACEKAISPLGILHCLEEIVLDDQGASLWSLNAKRGWHKAWLSTCCNVCSCAPAAAAVTPAATTSFLRGVYGFLGGLEAPPTTAAFLSRGVYGFLGAFCLPRPLFTFFWSEGTGSPASVTYQTH